MSESTNVKFTCIHVQTCMYTTSIRIHIHTVMRCETQLFFQLTLTSHLFDCSSFYLLFSARQSVCCLS